MIILLLLEVWLIILLNILGHNIGKSLKEKNCNTIIKEIISLSKKKKCNLIYPKDVIVAKNLNGTIQNKKN